MSIYRTIKKARDCTICHGTGFDDATKLPCPTCQGSGQIEIFARVSQAAASRATAATKELPPRARAKAKARLQDHEPGKKELPTGAKDSKVGEGFIDEE